MCMGDGHVQADLFRNGQVIDKEDLADGRGLALNNVMADR